MQGKSKIKKLNLREAISTCQLPVQEAVYNALRGLCLRKCLPRISFINTNLPQNTIRMIKSNEELKELPEESPGVFKRLAA